MMVADRFVQLDYLTNGRAMLGVGPGALVSDAVMMGIEPITQRPRMDESLGVIIQLLNGEVVTHVAKASTVLGRYDSTSPGSDYWTVTERNGIHVATRVFVGPSPDRRPPTRVERGREDGEVDAVAAEPVLLVVGVEQRLAVSAEAGIEDPVVVFDRARRRVVSQLPDRFPRRRREEIEVGIVALATDCHELVVGGGARLHPAARRRDLREVAVLEPIDRFVLDQIDRAGQRRRRDLGRTVHRIALATQVTGRVIDAQSEGQHRDQQTNADEPARHGKL